MEYGELGWIEIEGFPFWPARRADVLEVSADVQKLGREGLVLVYFFGSHAYGWMEPDKIRPWDDNFEKFTSVGRKGKLFQQALEEAYEWQKESYKKVPTRRRAQVKQRPPDLPAHLVPEKKKHEQALKQMMDLREKEWNIQQKKRKKLERGEDVSDSKEESVASKKSVGRPGRKPKKVLEKKEKNVGANTDADEAQESGSESDSFVVKAYGVEEDNEDSEDDGLAIFRKELQREFKKDSPLPTSEPKEQPKQTQQPQTASDKAQSIDLVQQKLEPESVPRIEIKSDQPAESSTAQAVNKTPTKPVAEEIRHVPPPCPDCGRKSKILLKSQVPSTSSDYRRKEAGEYSDSSLGIYLFYMLENHVHNLHDGFKPFKCIFPGCSDAYYTNFALRDHMDQHHADFYHLHDSFPRPIMIADQMNLSQDNEDKRDQYMDLDETTPVKQGTQQQGVQAMDIDTQNDSAVPKQASRIGAQGHPPAEQFNSLENSAEDRLDVKNLVNESDDDDFDTQLEKLKRVNNDTFRCEYPACEKIFIGFSARADRRKHVEISHLGLKRKPCDDCGRGVYNSLGSDRKRKFQGVKRGRGRPRKYPRPNEYPMVHTTSIISASNMPMNGSGGSSLANLVIKRGRGRPRKYPRPDEPSTGNSPIMQGVAMSAPINMNSLSSSFQRRGPGRPRKYPIANSPSDPHSPVGSSSPIISPLNDSHLMRQDMGGNMMKKRKGPGRPRKYPRLEGDALSSQDVNSESEGSSIATKKKLGYNLAQEAMFRNMSGVAGRPRQPNTFDPKAKRGRGRPRKADQRREGSYSGPSSAEGSDNEEWGGEGYSSGNEGDISDDESTRRRRSRIGGGPGRPKKPRGSDSDWNPPSYLKKTTIDYSAFFDPNNPNRAADIKNFMSSPVAMNLPPNIIAQMQSMQAAAANNTAATTPSGQEVGLFVDLVDLCEAEYSRRQPVPNAMQGFTAQPQPVNNNNTPTPNVNNNTNANVNSFNRRSFLLADQLFLNMKFHPKIIAQNGSHFTFERTYTNDNTMGTLEREQDVIKIFLVDGTCKGFLVTSTMTSNALKFLVAQKTNVTKSEWNNFGVFMATREKIVGPLIDKPFDVHKKWGRHSGFDLRFVFKRLDEPYPAESYNMGSSMGGTTGLNSNKQATPSTPDRHNTTSVAGTNSLQQLSSSPQTTFGTGAGSPQVFRRTGQVLPTAVPSVDPTVSYNTAEAASKVKSDPDHIDLGYDYNLEMNAPEYDMTYMKPTSDPNDVYSFEGSNMVETTVDPYSVDFAPNNRSAPEPQPRPALKASTQPGGVTTNTAQVPEVSRAKSTQVLKRPIERPPPPPVRAASQQLSTAAVPTAQSQPGLRRVVSMPKRPPPPSALRKGTSTRPVSTAYNSANGSPGNYSATGSTGNNNSAAIPKMNHTTSANNHVASPKVNGSNNYSAASPKTNSNNSAPRRPSVGTASSPKAIPKKLTPQNGNSPSNSPTPPRRFLHKTEDEAKSRHEQHKQIIINWINSQLACRSISIRNLTTDIHDGVALIKLLEVLSEKKLEKYNGYPKMMMQRLENLGHFLNFLRVLGIRIDGVSAEDLYVGNENLTLAILLVVLRKYGATVPKPARRRSRATSNSRQNTAATPTLSSPKRSPNVPKTDSPVRKTSRGNSPSAATNGTTTRRRSSASAPKSPVPAKQTSTAPNTRKPPPTIKAPEVPTAVPKNPVSAPENPIPAPENQIPVAETVVEPIETGSAYTYEHNENQMSDSLVSTDTPDDYYSYVEGLDTNSYNNSAALDQSLTGGNEISAQNGDAMPLLEQRKNSSFIRSLPRDSLSKSPLDSPADSPKLSPRPDSPRALIGQRGSVNMNPSPAVAIPSKPTVAEVQSPGAVRFRNSPRAGGATKLPPHKMLMSHSPTSKYMSHSRVSSNNLDPLKASSSPAMSRFSVQSSPSSGSASPAPLASPLRKVSITDESGNIYSEVVKLDALQADPADEIDPRFELDLTVNADSKTKNTGLAMFRDPSKTVMDLGQQDIEDIDDLMENIMMMTMAPNNNAEIDWQ